VSSWQIKFSALSAPQLSGDDLFLHFINPHYSRLIVFSGFFPRVARRRHSCIQNGLKNASHVRLLMKFALLSL